MIITTTPWIKASKSGSNGGQCVEVRRNGSMIEMRDSKDQGKGPILKYRAEDFRAFLAGVKQGEFDQLLVD